MSDTIQEIYLEGTEFSKEDVANVICRTYENSNSPQECRMFLEMLGVIE